MEDINEMLKTYNTYEVDWMGDKIESFNPLTRHHIIKKEKNGKNSITNYALLTVNSHRLLHFIEQKYNKYYIIINDKFDELNKSLNPPSEEYYIYINTILKKIKKQIKNDKRKRK